MCKKIKKTLEILLLSIFLGSVIPAISCTAFAQEMEEPEIKAEPVIKLSKTVFHYTGNEKQPRIEVRGQDGISLDPSEYTVTYPVASREIGRYTVKITIPDGDYQGIYKKKYKIVPAPAKITGTTEAVKGFHITWKKNSSGVTGYQIGYAKNTDFSDIKKKNVAGSDKTLGVIKGLNGHATYYVKVRRYYKTEDETFFSPWTEAEEIYTRSYNDNYKVLKDAEAVSGFQYINTDKKLSSSTKKALDRAVTTITNKGYRLGFVLLDLDTGEGIARNIDTVFNAASTIKGPYVCAITSQKPEKARKYRSSITRTIVNSSNYDYTSLRGIFGSEPLRVYMKEAHTSIPLSTWTRYAPRKLSMLWLRNWAFFESGTEDAKWTKKTFDHSYMAYINEQLAGSDVSVYSKPGWLYSGGPVAQHDAGIVEKDNGHTYLLTILSNAYGQKPILRNLVKELDKCEEELQSK